MSVKHWEKPYKYKCQEPGCIRVFDKKNTVGKIPRRSLRNHLCGRVATDPKRTGHAYKADVAETICDKLGLK